MNRYYMKKPKPVGIIWECEVGTYEFDHENPSIIINHPTARFYGATEFEAEDMAKFWIRRSKKEET